MGDKTVYLVIALFFGVSAIFCIAACSWIIAFERDWRQGDYFYGDINYLTQIGRDWSTQPFHDIVVTEETKCPDTHPDLVLYDVWLGIRTYCDCIERDGVYDLDRWCDKGEEGSHNSPLCYDMHAHAPVVQS